MGDKEFYKKNIYILYLLYFFSALTICWNVIYVLFFNALNLSFLKIGFLFSVATFTFMLLEIFTGLFTDKFGRRRSLIISNFLYLIASLIFAFSEIYPLFLFASFLIGVGGSFGSGSTDSLLFESLKHLKREKDYEKILSRNHFFLVSVGILTNFLIPLVFEINIHFPFMIGAFFAFLSLPVSLFLTESLDIERAKESSIRTQVSKIKEYILADKQIIWLLSFSSVFGLSIGIFGDILNQPLVKEGRSLFSYGLFFALATVLQSILLLKLYKILEFSKKFSSYLFLILVWSLSLFLFSLSKGVFLVILMGILWFMGSFKYILISSKINSFVKSNNIRATMHSINSMLVSLLFMIMAPIYGVFLDFYSLNLGLYLIVIFSLLSGLFFYIIKPKKV